MNDFSCSGVLREGLIYYYTYRDEKLSWKWTYVCLRVCVVCIFISVRVFKHTEAHAPYYPKKYFHTTPYSPHAHIHPHTPIHPNTLTHTYTTTHSQNPLIPVFQLKDIWESANNFQTLIYLAGTRFHRRLYLMAARWAQGERAVRARRDEKTERRARRGDKSQAEGGTAEGALWSDSPV